MFKKDEIPVIGILRGITEKNITDLIKVFKNTGIKYVEITMNTRNAAGLIAKMISEAGEELVVGAGTVLSKNDLNEALKAGAKFIVSPSVKDEIIEYCVDKDIPVFPGALTPTEVHRAMDLGATMVKLFPSGMYGPGYIKALKGPFDKMKIMAVGGINENNAGKYMNHGADAVAFGAGILRPNWMDEGRYDIIEEKIKQLVNNLNSE